MANKKNLNFKQKYGFSMPKSYLFRAKKGLNKKIVESISNMKNEPSWMLDFRLKSLEIFYKKTMPTWGADLSKINFDDIYYYIKPVESQAKSWADLPSACFTVLATSRSSSILTQCTEECRSS